ncbi:DUF3159 domain-containing protein [Streptomyces janthinus]|uniref:DUF3159 domain-containing protein n=1 Tax=Streptomyces violaceus TaxID=1936 RepID=A0ABY9UM89_STRVL|nr:DUF3159 domain-containing protein [Streptomyces janthinus]WND23693.1 DUF3159 domain-containing protein [Streptomyces janthinus]
MRATCTGAPGRPLARRRGRGEPTGRLTPSHGDFFLIGIWARFAGAVLLLASVLARRPLAGVLWNSTTGRGTAWRDDKRSRLYYDVANLTLAAIFTPTRKSETNPVSPTPTPFTYRNAYAHRRGRQTAGFRR